MRRNEIPCSPLSSSQAMVLAHHMKLQRDKAREAVDEFIELYERRPIRNNDGGMKFNHAFATWYMLRQLAPRVVVESGLWKGQSTWLIQQACPQAEVYCLDVNMDRVVYRHPSAHYIQRDFAQCDWSSVETDNAVCFFDDHQNAYSRLKDMRWSGFKTAIFEDNFPCGEGDCYSLRHMRAGFGHPHLQMSSSHPPGPLARVKIALIERILRQNGARQQRIVEPNLVDKANFEAQCQEYWEFPPVVRAATHSWGGSWTGPYESEAPLLDHSSIPPGLAQIIGEDRRALDYVYIAFLRLR